MHVSNSIWTDYLHLVVVIHCEWICLEYIQNFKTMDPFGDVHVFEGGGIMIEKEDYLSNH